jgi:hypothetical protein
MEDILKYKQCYGKFNKAQKLVLDEGGSNKISTFLDMLINRKEKE